MPTYILCIETSFYEVFMNFKNFLFSLYSHLLTSYWTTYTTLLKNAYCNPTHKPSDWMLNSFRSAYNECLWTLYSHQHVLTFICVRETLATNRYETSSFSAILSDRDVLSFEVFLLILNGTWTIKPCKTCLWCLLMIL